MAVHFTTIPCEPNTAHKAEGKTDFWNICPCTNYVLYTSLTDVTTFLYAFMNVSKAIFVGKRSSPHLRHIIQHKSSYTVVPVHVVNYTFL